MTRVLQFPVGGKSASLVEIRDHQICRQIVKVNVRAMLIFYKSSKITFCLLASYLLVFCPQGGLVRIGKGKKPGKFTNTHEGNKEHALMFHCLH